MRATLIQIGNSRGIRLPKSVIEQAALQGELELEVTAGTVTIRNARQPRQGWAAAAEACHQSAEDDLGDWDAVTNDFGGTW